MRSWTHLERQRGGLGFVGRPGETQIEADRRQIRTRIGRLERALDGVRRTRGLHREARRRVPYPVVALVGYTNAGKSTLFNRLTGAGTAARDQLFATLDLTMRALELPSGLRVILSDTVGFVSDLPHDLVAAFRATLEEVVAADLIVHVRDYAHADSAPTCCGCWAIWAWKTASGPASLRCSTSSTCSIPGSARVWWTEAGRGAAFRSTATRQLRLPHSPAPGSATFWRRSMRG